MFASQGFAAEVLIIADVKRATGQKGIKVDAKNPMKSGGEELNFATADDKMAMTVFVPPEFMYAL